MKKLFTLLCIVPFLGCAMKITGVPSGVLSWLRTEYREQYIDKLPAELKPQGQTEDDCFFSGWLVYTAHSVLLSAERQQMLDPGAPTAGALLLGKAGREAAEFHLENCTDKLPDGGVQTRAREYRAISYMASRAGLYLARTNAEARVNAEHAQALVRKIAEHERYEMDARLKLSMQVQGPPLVGAVGAADLTPEQAAAATALILSGPAAAAVAAVDWPLFAYLVAPSLATAAAAGTR